MALAVADRVWMLENAIYSVISPEGCASILWKNSAKAETAAEYLKLTAEDSLKNGIIEKIIYEDNLGKETFYTDLRGLLLAEFEALCAVEMEELLQRRYMRFRRIGTKEEQEECR